jgi:hypothetical protein
METVEIIGMGIFVVAVFARALLAPVLSVTLRKIKKKQQQDEIKTYHARCDVKQRRSITDQWNETDIAHIGEQITCDLIGKSPVSRCQLQRISGSGGARGCGCGEGGLERLAGDCIVEFAATS